jgi:error-prone DNA polymerase
VGLTLRQHPANLLRADLASQRIVTCADAMSARDGKWLTTAGLMLVRQKPGSAKGIMFITIEDETGVANLDIRPSLYERQRRIILAAGMIGVQGRVQRGGEVVHLVANQLTDLRPSSPPSASGMASRCRTVAATRSRTGAALRRPTRSSTKRLSIARHLHH